MGGFASVFGAIGGAAKGIFGIIGMIPTVVKIAETILCVFTAAKGQDKHSFAVTLVWEAIMAGEVISQKDIIDQELFAAGLDKVIHGTVDMLNASIWYKGKKI